MPSTDSRVFQQRSKETGDLEWFFESREGVMGPYDLEELVKLAIDRHIARCHRDRLDGGRNFAATRRLTSRHDTDWSAT